LQAQLYLRKDEEEGDHVEEEEGEEQGAKIEEET